MTAPDVVADTRFEQYYRNLLQVFLYVTDECNLRCTQCYYMPWLKKGHAEMPTDVLLALLRKFRAMGAIKLSFLGGEPTLYGQAAGNAPIGAIISEARKIGFQYLRMVTNGLFPETLLADDRLRALDEITFSIDGDTATLHDSLRGVGTFERTVANVKRAVALGYNVHITTCVHRGNVGYDDKHSYLLDRAIRWAASLGANLINFHPLFKMGIARDSWTGDTDISPDEWVPLYNAIHSNVDAGAYPIDVRIPQRFVTPGEFEREPARYGFCPVKLAERIEVHTNGQIHSCALNNGTPVSMAKFSRDEGGPVMIRWSPSRNELAEYAFDPTSDHPCAVMQADFHDRVPLCISFKPDQEEYIWKHVGLS